MDRRSLLALGAATAAVAVTGDVASAAENAPSDAALARSLGDFRSAYAQVNGTRLHYVTGGTGSPLVLLPGWPQTWWQFHKIMPALAKRHQVIAVDLRGMGGSGKPDRGYDKKTMARDIHELVRKLGHRKVDVAGHDIGAMVAHSFAVNHPDAVGKIALLDVPHPDDSLYDLTLIPRPGQPFFLWWFAFNQVDVLPGQLLAGRSRLLVDHLCGLMLLDQKNISDRDRDIYAHAYSTPDAVRAGNGWYQTFSQDIADQRTYPRLTTPVLGLISAANYDYVAAAITRHATDVRLVKVANTGHYLAEEQPAAVIDELTRYFG
ncbi:alpha/beta fold hydrolase [Actinocrispum wychmicini]|uniref:Pimeloyl-ACP methyl ester carboxylesterase n=1 Tax=Actinocrispum wychmicini TaxID=1213861 RepID=A0A4R2J6T1_9PSEU|nr:alpha/beta hydrolase [Actinocrispum wychmicini]TCO50895.1 pimeloyl-ACP methyl ester carboxylesterase [Actinocrispum wychmicini]